MKIFLAGTAANPNELETLKTSPYILEAYPTFKKWQTALLTTAKMFFLDSGAFGLRRKKENINWDEFTEAYAQFVCEHDIQYFFEVDVDNITGYEKTKEIRRRLEARTGRACIPVWHPNRGFQDYEEMCERYEYVSIGGIVEATGATYKKYHACFPALLKIAHKHGAKVHGLGMTKQTLLENCQFDSVDSTSWTSAMRWGQIYHFDGAKLHMCKHKDRRVQAKLAATHNNLEEWIKFQKYAEKNL